MNDYNRGNLMRVISSRLFNGNNCDSPRDQLKLSNKY